MTIETEFEDSRANLFDIKDFLMSHKLGLAYT